MQQHLFKLLFVGCSILVAGCKRGPTINICVSDPERSGFQCIDKNQKPYFVAFSDSGNYVATTPDDFSILLNYCGLKGIEGSKVIEYVLTQ